MPLGISPAPPSLPFSQAPSIPLKHDATIGKTKGAELKAAPSSSSPRRCPTPFSVDDLAPADDPSKAGTEDEGPPQAAAPTVSAMRASRVPSGLGSPTVVSLAVWCSSSALSCAPSNTIVVESQIQVMKPMAAPSEP